MLESSPFRQYQILDQFDIEEIARGQKPNFGLQSVRRTQTETKSRQALWRIKK